VPLNALDHLLYSDSSQTGSHTYLALLIYWWLWSLGCLFKKNGDWFILFWPWLWTLQLWS